MNITIQKSDLSRVLKLASSVADRKSTMPLLAKVVLRAKGKRLSIAATDLVVSVSSTCAATVSAPGAVALDAKAFADAVAVMPAESITLAVGDNHHATMTSGRVTMRLVGVPDRDFPRLPESSGDAVDVSSAELVTAIDRVAFSVCRDDTRFHLTGALWSAGSMVSTDGHRLSLTVASLPVDKPAIVPAAGMSAIKSIAREAEHVAMSTHAGYLFATTQDTTIAVKLIDAAYPPYDQVIPKGHANTLTIQRDRLLDGLRRASLMASDTRGVRLTLNGTVTLESTDPDAGDVREELDAEYDGQPVTIGVNPKYLVEALAACGDEVVLRFGGELDPVLVDGGHGFTGVVMPMRV